MALFSGLSEKLNHIFSKLTKHGKLTELEINNCENLTHLYAQNNKVLTTLKGTKTDNIVHLDISGSEVFTTLNCGNFVKLEYFY